jgi:Ni,Fe-hydrogenase III large subunit/Ni,Fe-hydrogenase III component G
MTTLRNEIMERLGRDAVLCAAGSGAGVDELRIPRERFDEAASYMKTAGARLVAEWGVDETRLNRAYAVYACFAKAADYLLVRCEVPQQDPTFPSLTKKYLPAFRFERQVESLMGLVPTGHVHSDHRPWIKFEDWPVDAWPLRKSFDPAQRMARVAGEYAWARARGEGVYEIPVGPVHAGIIEPGHFRFQAMGEEIINLEERLGYTHKGIEKRFEALPWTDGVRLAGRVSGDSTVAHALCWCRAVESLCGVEPPPRALWLRALFLERERIANHLGDIGAIANDAAFSFLLYQFSRLKEAILRTNRHLFGHRFLMDRVVCGGVAGDLPADGAKVIGGEMDWLSDEFERLVGIYDRSSSLEDRVRSTGILDPQQCRDLGCVGFVARACGEALDCRIQSPFPPYDRFPPEIALHDSCDVHARAWVRIGEIRDSIRLIRNFVATLPGGSLNAPVPSPAPDRTGFAVVEGWRGEIVYWVQSGPEGEVNRCMIRDPSSVNWLALEQAVLGNIVPDFPLCNKSFNQSYSGHDL